MLALNVKLYEMCLCVCVCLSLSSLSLCLCLSLSLPVLISPQINCIIVCFFPVMVDDVEAQQEFDDFFEEVFTELEDKV